MASDGEISCTTDPNFAVIYSFLKVFGKLYGLEIPTIAKLQELIENTQEVLDPLKELHVRLLRRALKSIQVNRWERALIKFCHQQRYHQEAWEIERFSYKKASTQVKLRILKLLLEYQFTCHPKFKNAVNALSSKELRLDPIGRDKYGCVYWLQIDHEANLCMYKEDQDEETWQLIASNREQFVKIISQLKSGEQVCQPVANEDSSSVDVPTQIEISKTEVEENEEEFLSPESESGNESDETKVEKCKDDNTSKEEEPEPPKDDAPKDIVKETVEESNVIMNTVDKVEDKKDNMTINNENDSKKEEEVCESNISEKETNKEETEEQEVGEEIGEEIEEPVMIIKGEGNGEDCESSYFIGEEISEPVMFIYGDGWGWDNDTGNPEALEQEENTELEENSDVDNPSEEVLNGEHANNVQKSNSRVKLNKSAKLKCRLSSVTKRSLRKQSNDNADVSKSDSKKHCVRNLDKSNGSNSIATSSQRELRRDSSVHEKSTDCESSGKKTKKIIRKVKKREGMRTLRNNKEIINSISEPENTRNSKSSIIEKRKSSVSSDHDGNISENAESENVEGEETKVEDTLPSKKIRLESTPESDNVSHSKSENVENIENNDGNTENDKHSITNRKKIKASKGKLKGKKLLQNKIQISEVSKDCDKIDVCDNKTSKALKRSLLNKSTDDKTKSESQSDSEDEEPVKSGKRLKFKPKKIVTKSRKKIEAKIMEKCSSESEDETLYSLGKKSAKKVLKKKPKAKEKEKTTAASTNVTDNDTPVRQSRRIAQMKIKEEADRRHLEEVTLRELKMIHKKKNKEEEEEEWQASASSSEGEARARRSAAWRSDSTGPEPDSDSDEPLFEHHDEPELEAPRSDHEFSPESDLESGEPTAPLKLARTLQQGKDEGFCKRCGSGEQPEWILLCDRCDAGYHASCLTPVLLLVPEGDWFCPPCNHEKLISALEEELVKYDQLVVAVEEERERRRAEHPHSDTEQEPDKLEHDDHKSDDKSDGSGSGSEWSSSSSSGAVYRLRARRQLPVSYRAQEYDRLISSAIKEEYVEPTTSAGNQGRGKDISTIIEAAEEEKMKAEREARDQGEAGEVGEGSQKKQKKKQRRKPRKLNSLDVPSEDDDETDEDFKDTGMESSSEDISSSAERDSRSSDSLPIIRPGRNDKKERTKLEESSPEVKKKKKGIFEDSSSESADTKELPKKTKSRKRGDGRRSKLTQYDAAGNVVRARVTYGGLSDGPGPNDWSPKHRTRQRKINYTEMPNTESEDEMHKSSGKHMADSSDEFRVTDEWENSSSGSERAKRPRGEGGEEGEGGAEEEERRRALCDLVTKTAVVPLEKLPEHVTREKTEQLHQHLLDAQQADLAARPMRGRGGRGGGRGSRGPRGGRGRGGVGGGGGGGGASKSSPSSDDALAKLVGVKIKDLRETGEMPMRPNQAERDRKRQEREAKQAEKEARRLERLQKKEEKEKIKEQRAKEREEKKLARLALQESRRVKREKVEYMPPVPVGAGPGGMRPPPPGSAPPPPHAPHDYRERFPATPRLQVRAELRGIAMGDDRMQLMHRPEQAPPREGTLSVAGSPQPFKPAPEEPSLITRMPHMLNHQYRGPMMYSGGAGGSSGYGPRSQNMMYQLHPGMNRAQYPQGYYQHLRAMPPAYPGHPPSPGMHPPAPQHRQGPPPPHGAHGPPGSSPHHGPPGSSPHHGPPGSSPHHGPPGSSPHHGPPGSSPHHGPHGPPVSSPLQYGSGPAGPHPHPGSSAIPPGAPGNLHGSPVSSHGAPGASLGSHGPGPGPNHGPIPPNMQGPRSHMPHAGPHPMGPGHMGPRGLHGPHNSSINPHGAVPGPPGLGANGSIGPNPHGPLGSRLHGPPGMLGPPGHGPPGANPLGPRAPEDSSPHRPGPSPLSAMAHSLPPGLGPQGLEGHGPIGPTALPVHRPPFAPGPPGITAAGLQPNSIPDQTAVATRPGSAPRPASTASPGQSPHPPNLTPAATSSPPVSAEPPIQIKAEVKTEPEYRTPPGSPSHRPPSPEPLRNHPKIKHTDNKDRRPRYPLGPYAPQYGPYGPYAPPAAQPPDAAMNLQARPQHPSPLQRIHANMAQYLPALADKPEPFLQHMRLPRPPYGAPPLHAPHASPGPRYADLQQRPTSPTPPPQAPQPAPAPPPAPISPEIRKDESPKVAEEEVEGENSQPSSPPDTKPDFSRIETVNKMEPLKAPEHIKVEAEAEAGAGAGAGAREEGGEFGGLVSYFSSQHEDDLDA